MHIRGSSGSPFCAASEESAAYRVTPAAGAMKCAPAFSALRTARTALSGKNWNSVLR